MISFVLITALRVRVRVEAPRQGERITRVREPGWRRAFHELEGRLHIKTLQAQEPVSPGGSAQFAEKAK